MYDDRALVGEGGWLAFFVITLAVITPLSMTVGTAISLYGDPAVGAAYGDRWIALQAYYWVLSLAVCASAWFMTWRLIKVKVRRTVRIVIAGIWLIGVGYLVLEGLGLWLIGGISFDLALPGVAPALPGRCIYGTIWTAYFLRSRRVANTYLRDSDESDVAEIFG